MKLSVPSRGQTPRTPRSCLESVDDDHEDNAGRVFPNEPLLAMGWSQTGWKRSKLNKDFKEKSSSSELKYKSKFQDSLVHLDEKKKLIRDSQSVKVYYLYWCPQSQFFFIYQEQMSETGPIQYFRPLYGVYFRETFFFSNGKYIDLDF